MVADSVNSFFFLQCSSWILLLSLTCQLRESLNEAELSANFTITFLQIQNWLHRSYNLQMHLERERREHWERFSGFWRANHRSCGDFWRLVSLYWIWNPICVDTNTKSSCGLNVSTYPNCSDYFNTKALSFQILSSIFNVPYLHLTFICYRFMWSGSKWKFKNGGDFSRVAAERFVISNAAKPLNSVFIWKDQATPRSELMMKNCTSPRKAVPG